MSIGIRLHDVTGATIEEKAALAKRQGFDCLHLAVTKVISPDLWAPAASTPGLASYLRNVLAPLDVAVLGCYLNLAVPDVQEYRRTLDKYIAQLKLGRWLGVGVVGTETGNPMPGQPYDPAVTHSEDALKLFIDRVAPVVEAAEKLGVTFAIEPVHCHIVNNGKRARQVLDAIHSPNLQIILDPVNLLGPDEVDRRDAVIEEAIDLLSDDVAVVHIKDYVLNSGKVQQAVAVGTGLMDYTTLAKWIVKDKPHVQMTLENTNSANAEQCRCFVEAQLARAGSEL